MHEKKKKKNLLPYVVTMSTSEVHGGLGCAYLEVAARLLPCQHPYQLSSSELWLICKGSGSREEEKGREKGKGHKCALILI